MLASELIDPTIQTILPTCSAEEALSILQDQLIGHVVVQASTGAILSILSEDQLMEAAETLPVGALINSHHSVPLVHENQSELEAIRQMAQAKLELLPVINDQEECIGIISIRTAFFRMGTNFAPSVPGGILVIGVHPLNYQLSQIAQIVESGDAYINAMYTETIEEGRKLLITLFTNKIDLDGIVQTFHRYDYEVIGTFYQSLDRERLKERYLSLMRYLST